MLKCLNIRVLLIFFKYLFQHQQNKCVCVSRSHSVTLRKKYQNIAWICRKSVLLRHQSLNYACKFFLQNNKCYLSSLRFHPSSCITWCSSHSLFSVPALFFLPFLPIEVFPPRSALDNALSFIHDILITNSVINTLPDQCLSSIMTDRCGLMLHKELAGLLRTNSNVAGVESSIAKGDRRRIPGWCPCFQRIIKQLVLFVTVTAHLSSVDC